MRFMRSEGFNSPTPTPKEFIDTFHHGEGSWWSARLPNYANGWIFDFTASWVRAAVSRDRLLQYGVGRRLYAGERPRAGDLAYYKLEGLDEPWSHAAIVTKVTRRSVYIAQHTRDYEKAFADVIDYLKKTKGPLGTAWTYEFIRPTYTAYNIG
jgi:hypothetical protein